MNSIPTEYSKFITEVFEEEGVQWLQKLPLLIAKFEQQWSFSAEPPFPNLSYNYVAPVKMADGSEAVLKLGVPRPELHTEIEALRLYNGRGAVQLLAAAPDEGAMLLERLRPGQMLSVLAEQDDEAATRIAADLMQRLWRPLPQNHPFPTIADWGKGLHRLRQEFNGGTGPFPRELVQEAETHYRELSASAAEPLLLHGDFHHWNIMTADREPWLIIDPKGLAGEPAYEICPLLYNPVGFLSTWPNPAQTIARRIAILSEHLALDKTRIINWGIYQCLLSAWWSYEGEGYGWEDTLEIATILRNIGRRNP